MDNTNIGLVNLSENYLTNFGIGEILTVLLLMLVIAIIGAYCCKKRKQARMFTYQDRCKMNCTLTDRDFKLCQQVYQVHQSQWWLLVHLELVKFITNRKEHCRDYGSLASRSCFGGTGGFNSFQWSCKDDGRVNGEMNDKNNNFYHGTFGRINIFLIYLNYMWINVSVGWVFKQTFENEMWNKEIFSLSI